MDIKKWIIPVLLSILTWPAGAQENPLSLQEALNYALDHNRELALTRLDEDLGAYKTREIRGQALPQISAGGNYTYNIKRPVLVFPPDAGAIFGGGEGGELPSGIPAGFKFTTAFDIQFSQQLFNQAVFTGLKAAKAGEAFYELNTEVGEEELIYNIAGLYYQLQVAAQQLNVLDANIRQVEQLLKSTKSQYENGLVKKNDLDRIRVNYTNITSQRANLENQLKMQTNQLKLAMGMEVSEPLQLPEPDLEGLKQTLTGGAVLEELDLAGHAQHRLLEKQKELLEYDKKAKEAEYYPTLSLFGNYSANGNTEHFNFQDDFWYGTSAVGLSLNIPIFSGGTRKSRVNQAEVELLKINKQQEQSDQALETAFENARLQLNNSINTIRVQEENMELAQEVYESTQNNYRLGLESLTDLLNSEVALIEAQNTYTNALLEYRIARLDVLKSNGNIKTLTQ